MDRVKESVFNVISGRAWGSSVLDLFAGTGSLGLECLSRGSDLVYFVDNNIQSIELIKHNTESLISNVVRTIGFEVIQKDVLEYLRFCNDRKWDIIFLDPPYKIDATEMKEIFEIIAEKKIVGKDSILIYEFFFKREIGWETGRFRLVKELFFGDKKVIYLQLKE